VTDAPALPYKHSVNYHVHALASSLFKGATQFYMAHFGVGLPEMRLLSTLSSEGPLAGYQLVALTAMDKALVSRVLAALGRRTYVKGSPPDADARRRVWSLTRSGEQLVKRLQPQWRQREAIIQADLSATERKLLVDMMQRMFSASEALRAEEARQLKAPRKSTGVTSKPAAAIRARPRRATTGNGLPPELRDR
jgi:DNA-binding MarR family transcriptional regulator